MANFLRFFCLSILKRDWNTKINTKCKSLSWKSRSLVRILIYGTWSITVNVSIKQLRILFLSVYFSVIIWRSEFETLGKINQVWLKKDTVYNSWRDFMDEFFVLAVKCLTKRGDKKEIKPNQSTRKWNPASFSLANQEPNEEHIYSHYWSEKRPITKTTE